MPETLRMPEVAAAMAHTYFDCAATPFLYRPQVFESVAAMVGADKILFGSDYPLLSPKRVMDQIACAALPADQAEQFLLQSVGYQHRAVAAVDLDAVRQQRAGCVDVAANRSQEDAVAAGVAARADLSDPDGQRLAQRLAERGGVQADGVLGWRH